MANKTKTIKGATDKELDELLLRLRKENELQNLIAEIKRKASPNYIPYDNPNISTEEPIDSLYHYGILGMKWGRRRARGGKVSTSKTKKIPGKEDSEDHKKKLSLKRKSLSEMSNSELKEFNNRLQLERQYKDLTKAEVSAGRRFVSDVISGAAKQTATTYVAKYMSKGVDQLLKKAAK